MKVPNTVKAYISSRVDVMYGIIFKKIILIALSNIILCQVEGITAVIVSDRISGSVSDVNNNKFENHKNCTFKHLLPSSV